MADGCPGLSLDGAFLSGVLGHVDCQAQTIGTAGWQALAHSGMPLVLTGALTIFVALIGYRMLLGDVPGLRDGVTAVARLGFVMLLATSWPAFRTLAYDVAMQGPADLAGQIGQAAALPGSAGGLVARLQGVDDALAELTELGAGRPPDATIVAGPTQPLNPQQMQQQMQALQQAQQRPRWDPARDASLLGSARALYLAATIAAFASVRLTAGLLLALGPLFAIFLLFDATRGLFEGWVRGVAGTALGALATTVLLGVELALVEPWLGAIVETRREGTATPTVPIELLVVTIVFALTLLAALVATARVAYGFRLPWRSHAVAATPAIPATIGPARIPAVSEAANAPAEHRQRALAIADAVASTQRREAAALPVAAPSSAAPRGLSSAPSWRDIDMAVATAPGRGVPRRTRGRVSAGAARRDGRA